jgi:hypothetical protein
MNSKWLCGAITVLLSVSSIKLPVFAQEPEQGNQTKASQCNEIIALANAAVRDTKQVTNNGRSSDSEMLLKAAEYMDNYASKLEGVHITDPILQGYQSRFIVMYKQTSNATRDFITAFNAKNFPGAESALRALRIATTGEKQLVNEINIYCQSR